MHQNSTALNCTFFSNSASFGGAIYGDCSGPSMGQGNIISNCIIAYNRAPGGGAYGGGGGIAGQRNDFFIGCLISNNETKGNGGGSMGPSLSNCVVVNNLAAGQGGGMTIDYGNAVLNCDVFGNRASNGGGMAANGYISYNTYVRECRFSNNICLGGANGGGGIYVSHMKVEIRNCLFVNNTNLGTKGGGGVYANNGRLINCTIANNYSTNGGGGVAAYNTNSFFTNCIIYGNTAYSNAYADIFNTGDNSNSYWYCCANPTSAPLARDQGNITNDPVFAGVGIWRLGPGTPCANTGTNQDWMFNAPDVGGGPRIRYGTVDMGAYEYIHQATIYNFH